MGVNKEMAEKKGKKKEATKSTHGFVVRKVSPEDGQIHVIGETDTVDVALKMWSNHWYSNPLVEIGCRTQSDMVKLVTFVLKKPKDMYILCTKDQPQSNVVHFDYSINVIRDTLLQSWQKGLNGGITKSQFGDFVIRPFTLQ